MDHIAVKIGLTILSVIPVVGLLGAIWIWNFPAVQDHSLQNRYRFDTDVLDRWRHVFEEKDERKKRRLTKSLLEDDDDAKPLDAP